MIFAIFRTMFMVSLNKIGTRVLEHEPKVRVAFLLDTRYLSKPTFNMNAFKYIQIKYIV